MSIEVKGRQGEYGTTYSITVNGITIHGCERKTGTSDKGAYDFISTPSKKKENGEWFNFLYIERELGDKMLQAVIEYENNGEPPTEKSDLEAF